METFVSVPVYPTEDKSLVLEGLSKLFAITTPNQTTSQDIIELSKKIERASLDMLRTRIFELKIIDVVRSELRTRWYSNHTSLALNKQAAIKGVVSVIDSSMGEVPLGCIEVRLTFESEDEFEEFLSWFTPQTKDGRVVKD